MLKCMAKKIILVQCTLPFMNKKHFSPFSACETSDNSLLDGLLVSDTQRLRAMNKTSHFSLMNIPNRDSTSASPPDSLLALAPWLPWSTWKHADYYAGVCAWRGGKLSLKKNDKQENAALHCSSCRLVSEPKAILGSSLSHVGTFLFFNLVLLTSQRNKWGRKGIEFMLWRPV